MVLKSVETASDIAKLKKSFLIGIQSYFPDIKKKLYTHMKKIRDDEKTFVSNYLLKILLHYYKLTCL